MTSPDPKMCCEAVRSALLTTDWLFVYTADLADVTERHGVTTRVCRRHLLSCIERYLLEVGHWMSSKRLRLNSDKTELLWAGSGTCPVLGHLIDCGPASAELFPFQQRARSDYCHQIWQWISTFLMYMYALPVVIGSGN